MGRVTVPRKDAPTSARDPEEEAYLRALEEKTRDALGIKEHGWTDAFKQELADGWKWIKENPYKAALIVLAIVAFVGLLVAAPYIIPLLPALPTIGSALYAAAMWAGPAAPIFLGYAGALAVVTAGGIIAGIKWLCNKAFGTGGPCGGETLADDPEDTAIPMAVHDLAEQRGSIDARTHNTVTKLTSTSAGRGAASAEASAAAIDRTSPQGPAAKATQRATETPDTPPQKAPLLMTPIKRAQARAKAAEAAAKIGANAPQQQETGKVSPSSMFAATAEAAARAKTADKPDKATNPLVFGKQSSDDA